MKKFMCCFFFFVFIFFSEQAYAASQVTLQESITNTLETSNLLRGIEENSSFLDNKKEQIRTANRPQINAYAQIGAMHGTSQTTRDLGRYTDTYPNTEVSIVATQRIWDSKKSFYNIESVDFSQDAITMRWLDNATSLALDALIAHIDLKRYQDIIDITTVYVNNHKEMLAKQRALSELGVFTEADVVQAQGRLASAEAALAQAQLSFQKSLVKYNSLTRINLNNRELASIEMYNITDEIDIILNNISTSSPKIKAYADDIKAIQSTAMALKADYLPQVRFEIGPNYVDTNLKRGDSHTIDVQATVKLEWKLYSSGLNRLTQEAQNIQERITRYDALATIDSLEETLFTTWEEYKNNQILAKHYGDALQFNIATRDAYKEQFNVSLRSLLDVLDAENEVYNSSVQKITAEANSVVNSYKILALEGSLLERLGIQYNINTNNPTNNPINK